MIINIDNFDEKRYEKITCLVCHKPFLRRIKKSKWKMPSGIRRAGTITCSRKCAIINIRVICKNRGKNENCCINK